MQVKLHEVVDNKLNSKIRYKLWVMLWRGCSYKDIKRECMVCNDTISRYKRMWGL